MASKFNKPLIRQAVIAAEANRRQGTSHVKTRGEVSGGGKKPWRQKGTGRARAGSSRSPIWVGGGKVFGPAKERHYKQQLPKKMSRQALEQLFNYLLENKKLIVTDSLAMKEVKTKAALTLLKKNEVLGKKVLLITATIEPELILSARNIPGVKVMVNHNLSILDLSSTELVLIDKKSAQSRNLVKEQPKPKKSTQESK